MHSQIDGDSRDYWRSDNLADEENWQANCPVPGRQVSGELILLGIRDAHPLAHTHVCMFQAILDGLNENRNMVIRQLEGNIQVVKDLETKLESRHEAFEILKVMFAGYVKPNNYKSVELFLTSTEFIHYYVIMAHRKQCPSCGEELAHAAYSRHIHDHTGSVCPGRELQVQMIMSPRPSTSESSEGGSDFEDDLSSEDDSFDFGSAGDESDQAGCSYSADMPGEQVFNSDSDNSIYSDLSSNNAHDVQSDEEIWESSDDEDLDSDDFSTCDNQTVRNVLFGVSLFLNFFQLTYRVSERAMTTLLTFLRTLITYLATASQGNLILNALAQTLPKSLYSIRKLVARYQGGVSEYAVCPVCHTLDALSDCIITENGMKKSKHCNFVAFPNHPHRSRRSKCNTALMKQVRVGGKTKLVPKKRFLYHSVISGLQKLIARKGFLQHCERWRDRSSSIPDGVHADIYDGNVWKEFQYINGRPFLASPANLCSMLNTDWFNPFDETQYSVGAIYLVVQNLPRSERFKAENIILIGLIPGPTEPSKTMNTYLVPLVDDLLKLYSGVTLPNPHSIFGSTNIRAVLSCIVCDLPATRKVCGFLGQNATKGCSKCLHEFKTVSFGSKADFSGYDCDDWEPRDLNLHHKKSIDAKNAFTASEREQIEKLNGARYTELSRLPYLNIIRHHVIDPMHNLFLGLAKHVTNTQILLPILLRVWFRVAVVQVILPGPQNTVYTLEHMRIFIWGAVCVKTQLFMKT